MDPPHRRIPQPAGNLWLEKKPVLAGWTPPWVRHRAVQRQVGDEWCTQCITCNIRAHHVHVAHRAPFGEIRLRKSTSNFCFCDPFFFFLATFSHIFRFQVLKDVHCAQRVRCAARYNYKYKYNYKYNHMYDTSTFLKSL